MMRMQQPVSRAGRYPSALGIDAGTRGLHKPGRATIFLIATCDGWAKALVDVVHVDRALVDDWVNPTRCRASQKG